MKLQQRQTMDSKTEEEKREIQDKIYQTKKRNNSLCQSNPEKECGIKLKNKFKDIQEQYKSEKYPFNCDFYVPSLDLYIELNFHWTHGKCVFNKDNPKHQQILENWEKRSKNSKYYKNAIYVWTDLDTRKHQICIENKVNRIVFYNSEELNNWLEKI